MNVLITGAAGFIGFFLSEALLREGNDVTGLDNLNDYYDVKLKKGRLSLLEKYDRFSFCHMDISNRPVMQKLFSDNHFDVVVNLAAQAGVRYSIENPNAYIDSNLTGFANILEGCRHAGISHLVYASSSSVYGANKKMPFSIEDNVDHPVSLYAATKKSNELMAHAYSHLYGMPVTGLRFFTVYGPWGRPDMAYFKFTKAILKGKPIDVYNYGSMKRDFTYIDDIVKGVIKIISIPPPSFTHGPFPSGSFPPDSCSSDSFPPDSCSSDSFPPDSFHSDSSIGSHVRTSEMKEVPYALYNIGNNAPIKLNTFIETLEKILGRRAIKNMLPMQPGDVPATYADIDALTRKTGFKPETSIQEGLKKFVLWYKEYYL